MPCVANKRKRGVECPKETKETKERDVECPKACGEAVKKTTEYAMNGDIDIYDIYVDVCLDKESNALVRSI